MTDTKYKILSDVQTDNVKTSVQNADSLHESAPYGFVYADEKGFDKEAAKTDDLIMPAGHHVPDSMRAVVGGNPETYKEFEKTVADFAASLPEEKAFVKEETPKAKAFGRPRYSFGRGRLGRFVAVALVGLPAMFAPMKSEAASVDYRVGGNLDFGRVFEGAFATTDAIMKNIEGNKNLKNLDDAMGQLLLDYEVGKKRIQQEVQYWNKADGAISSAEVLIIEAYKAYNKATSARDAGDTRIAQSSMRLFEQYYKAALKLSPRYMDVLNQQYAKNRQSLIVNNRVDIVNLMMRCSSTTQVLKDGVIGWSKQELAGLDKNLQEKGNQIEQKANNTRYVMDRSKIDAFHKVSNAASGIGVNVNVHN